jgi:hypothetical protein
MSEKEEFWQELLAVVMKVGDKEGMIIGGDMNGHVGSQVDGYEGVHGGFGYGERNVEGEMLLEFAEATELVITNTFYTKSNNRKVTYCSGGAKSMIDFLLVRRRDRSMVKDVKVIPGEECLTQHRLLVCTMQLKETLMYKKAKSVSRCRIWRLKDKDYEQRFRREVRNGLVQGKSDSVEQAWKDLKVSFTEAAEKVCGHTKGRVRRRVTWWWNKEVGEAVETKRKLFKEWAKSKTDGAKEAYYEAKRNARRAVAAAQEAARKCLVADIDSAESRGQLFRAAKQTIRNNRDVVGEGCVKNGDQNIITDSEEIKQVWTDYYNKLLNEEFKWDRDSLPSVEAVCGPNDRFTESEVKVAMHEMKLGKAAGPSGVVAEMLKATGVEGIEWLADFFNRIVYEGKIPSDWALSWMTSVYKGKGDALDCSSYRGIKLLEHTMKVFERVIEKRLRSSTQINEMQFGFRPGCGATDAIFIVRQLQERYLGKKKEVWMAFVDLEKAFDRVPREVLWWALRKVGTEEWLVRVIRDMYVGVRTAVKTKEGVGKEFEVKVGVHQGSVLSPLLFTIVLEALSKEFREGLPWELLYADDLVLIAETERELAAKIKVWKTGLESKGLKVNVAKTKVMRCAVDGGKEVDSGKWPCGVCHKGVGRNSIQCQTCQKWTHKRCSGVIGKLKLGMSFQCSKCSVKVKVPVDQDSSLKKVVLTDQGVEFEHVDKFCYLGDMLGAGGGAGDAVRTRIRCAWAKFRELCPILTLRGASLKAKGRIYSACVRSVMIYGSETWPMKVEDKQRLERTENMMVRWMCGASVRDRIRTEELRGRLAIEGIADIVRRGRLRWFGHVERKTEEDWVSTVRKLDVAGSRGPGRGKKTWSQVVTEDLELMGLRREEALDRDAWRRSIYGRPVQPVQARKKRR